MGGDGLRSSLDSARFGVYPAFVFPPFFMTRIVAVFSFLALLLVGCSGSDQTVRIGFLGPLTGDLAAAGADQLNAVRLVVDEVNAAGGIGGKNVELIAEDGRCNGADSASAAQKLVNVDKVVAIIGGGCSSETLAAAPIAEAAKVVMISPISSSPAVTDAGDYIFRNYPSDGLKGKALGTFLKNAGYKKLAIIGENTDFCQGILNAVKKDLPEGISIVFNESVDQGTRDFRTLMTRLKDTDFDVFLANGQSDASVAEMAKQMRALGMTQQIVGTDTSDSANLGELAKEAVEGLKPLSVPNLSEDNPKAAEFAKIFRQRFDEPKFGMFFAALAYDAAAVLFQQIAAHGTGEALKNSLYSLQSFEGVAGTFHFDSNGDVSGIPFAMKVFKDGKLEQSELIPL